MSIISPLKKLFNYQLGSERIPEAIVKIQPASDVYITSLEHESTVSKTLIVDLGYVDSNSITAIQFHLVNPGRQTIGDKIIIVSQPDTSNTNITYCFDDTDFYLSQCGGPETPPCVDFSEGEPERDVTIFTYDGAKFCCTYDNC